MSPLGVFPIGSALRDRHRPVLVDLAVLDEMSLRTYDGRRLVIDWGEPNIAGVYSPTLTTTDDGQVMVGRVVLAELERRAGGA